MTPSCASTTGVFEDKPKIGENEGGSKRNGARFTTEMDVAGTFEAEPTPRGACRRACDETKPRWLRNEANTRALRPSVIGRASPALLPEAKPWNVSS
jgi:hypothetical protein